MKMAGFCRLLLIWASISSVGFTGDRPASRLLLIGIDGLRPDALTAAQTPHLDQLIADGAYSDTTLILGDRYRGNDTVSGPGWSSYLTGVWADKHGVQDNGFDGRNYSRYPHVFSLIRRQFPRAVTATFVDWEPIDKYIVADATRRVVYPAEGPEGYTVNDSRLAMEAAEYIRSDDPDAVMVYLGAVDETGHKYGFHPSVPEYVHAIQVIDGHVGQLLAAVKSRPRYVEESWLVIVSTDHGGSGTSHGGGHDKPEVLTTFLIVSGDRARKGAIDVQTYVVDVVPTGLVHLGVDIRPEWEIDGTAVGLNSVRSVKNSE